MYTKSARFYDAIYSFKDYAAESEQIHVEIQVAKRSPGNRLLDVACGTGQHLVHLVAHYDAEGLDLEPELLSIARQRLPDLTFHEGDMATFELGVTFDAVTCLFSAIGYAGTAKRLQATLRQMSAHLNPGGVALIEPWFTPDAWQAGGVHMTVVDQPDLKIARTNISGLSGDGKAAIMDMHHLVGTPDGISHFVEHHEIALFRHEEYVAAFESAGLEVTHDPQGLTGRGLYVGTKVV